MKIARITCRVVDFPLERDFHPAWARGRNQPNLLMVLIEVETDTGITGIGAAHAGLEAAITIERFVAPYFIGQDPTYIDRLLPLLRDTDILGAPAYLLELPPLALVGPIPCLPGSRLSRVPSARVPPSPTTAHLPSPSLPFAPCHPPPPPRNRPSTRRSPPPTHPRPSAHCRRPSGQPKC